MKMSSASSPLGPTPSLARPTWSWPPSIPSSTRSPRANRGKRSPAYRQQAATKSDLDRTDLAKDKTGVFTGGYAINPVSLEAIPIWIADYVLMGYGTGAIMAVPAHDERDFEFARKFDLDIIEVVADPAETPALLLKAYEWLGDWERRRDEGSVDGYIKVALVLNAPSMSKASSRIAKNTRETPSGPMSKSSRTKVELIKESPSPSSMKNSPLLSQSITRKIRKPTPHPLLRTQSRGRAQPR